ncbi:Nicotinamidase-related amidase [Rhizobium mongolense subsp. loessense]|uniref:Nicotinamidase-related amidase n=1 Tax=Rhizobium mongolense subsp. loessense TaxID=158890 RepID=A0A1G4PEC3_9HYPH|nr:isochorismatase family protein [Rhizobium mongolense]SCW30600.1 Nicotinamidase-related amidase [Rhizobium mongolense subsp. loessense]
MVPLTLLQHAGVTPKTADWSKSVVVVIDAQNEYVAGALPLHGIAAPVGEIRKLLDAARRDGVPVIHIVHHAAPGSGVFAIGSHGAKIISALTPADGEAVIAKTLPNAFAGTTLAAALAAIAEQTGRSDVILVGFMTHMCVSATARAALDLGIKATVIASAAMSRDLPDPLGGMIPAKTVHRTALAEIADRFATVVPDIAVIVKQAATD